MSLAVAAIQARRVVATTAAGKMGTAARTFLRNAALRAKSAATTTAAQRKETVAPAFSLWIIHRIAAGKGKTAVKMTTRIPFAATGNAALA